LLIALALVGFIMVAAALGFQAAQASYSYNSERNELVARVRGVTDRIAQDIRRCSAFEVIDLHTLNVTTPDGITHTYAWDGVGNGTLVYTETPDGLVVSDPVTLTPYVESFEVSDASPACRLHIVLRGTKASSQATITATPAKSLF
jgi:YD repeat-containing protein